MAEEEKLQPQAQPEQEQPDDNGWDSNGQGETPQAVAEEAKVEEPAEKATEEEPKPEPKMDDEAKRFRDKYATTKSEAEILRQTLRKLEEDGLLDRDEIAEKLGRNRAEVDAIIDRKSTYEPGDEGYVSEAEQKFKDDYNNPVLDRPLTAAYGPRAERDELMKAYAWFESQDPDLAKRRAAVPAEELVYFALDEGKRLKADYEAAQSIGGPSKMLAKIRDLEQQLADKQPAPATTQAQPEQSANDNDEVIEDPLAAREKRLRALRSY